MVKKLYKAELYVGKVKKTKNQKKKHVLQMNDLEIHYLKKQIKLFPTWKLKESKHLKRKRVSFDMTDIEETLLSSNVQEHIVEFNVTHAKGTTERRVVLECPTPRLVKFRSFKKTIIEDWASLSFVISLDTYEIVTVYWNHVDDTHENRDWSRYSKSLRILPKEVRKPIRNRNRNRNRNKKPKELAC